MDRWPRRRAWFSFMAFERGSRQAEDGVIGSLVAADFNQARVQASVEEMETNKTGARQGVRGAARRLAGIRRGSLATDNSTSALPKPNRLSARHWRGSRLLSTMAWCVERLAWLHVKRRKRAKVASRCFLQYGSSALFTVMFNRMQCWRRPASPHAGTRRPHGATLRERHRRSLTGHPPLSTVSTAPRVRVRTCTHAHVHVRAQAHAHTYTCACRA